MSVGTRYVQLKEVFPGIRKVISVVKVPAWYPGGGNGLVEAPLNVPDPRLRQMYRWRNQWIDQADLKKKLADGRVGVQWMAPLLDGSGYAEAARNYVAALHRAGGSVDAKAVSFEAARADYGAAGEVVTALLGRGIDHVVKVIYMTPEHFPMYKEFECYNIGFFTWETEILPDDWVRYCNSMDEIWVPCRWNADVCIANGVRRPVHVFGHCALPDEYALDGPRLHVPGVDPKAYKFYSIFQWTERKNPNGLLKAYLTAFTNKDPVVLILKTYRSDYSAGEKNAVLEALRGIQKEVGNEKNQPAVVVLPDMLSKADVLALHRLGDCFVLLHRSEGWGLPHFEACLMGKPVITTRFGGNLEFNRPEHSYLVDYEAISVGGMPHIRWYEPRMKWAEPDVDECRYFMRHVFGHRQEAAAKGWRARDYVRGRFSWDVVGKAMKKRLAEIWSRL